jgi:hypothetical protein
MQIDQSFKTTKNERNMSDCVSFFEIWVSRWSTLRQNAQFHYFESSFSFLFRSINFFSNFLIHTQHFQKEWIRYIHSLVTFTLSSFILSVILSLHISRHNLGNLPSNGREESLTHKSHSFGMWVWNVSWSVVQTEFTPGAFEVWFFKIWFSHSFILHPVLLCIVFLQAIIPSTFHSNQIKLKQCLLRIARLPSFQFLW